MEIIIPRSRRGWIITSILTAATLFWLVYSSSFLSSQRKIILNYHENPPPDNTIREDVLTTSQNTISSASTISDGSTFVSPFKVETKSNVLQKLDNEIAKSFAPVWTTEELNGK
jgi:hypothetical protein